MAKKINPWLAQHDAHLEAIYMQKMRICSEIDMLAMMLMLSDDLHVGPGRAAGCLNDMLANKVEIADKILEDAEDDDEILVIKHDLAGRMKEIFGDKWDDVKEWFPLLKIYW